MPRPDYTPFKECPNGHDLTLPGAFLYIANGQRVCRTCAASNARKRANNTAYGDIGRLL